jgi:hypothetical protein
MLDGGFRVDRCTVDSDSVEYGMGDKLTVFTSLGFNLSSSRNVFLSTGSGYVFVPTVNCSDWRVVVSSFDGEGNNITAVVCSFDNGGFVWSGKDFISSSE